ncbi:MAG: transglycosylase SLT domain-containing protein [Bryobacteraceae bacterium]
MRTFPRIFFGPIFVSLCFAPALLAAKKPVYRMNFMPPAAKPLPPAPVITETPSIDPDPYGRQAVNLELRGIPKLARPSDVDFRLRQAEEFFAQGKKAYQDGKLDEARTAFNRAIDALLGPKDGQGARESLPEPGPERSRLERRVEQLVEDIFHYDLDGLGASDSEDRVAYDKAPLDNILNLTLPIDPQLKKKVTEEVRVTASGLPLEETDAVTSYINFFSSERGRRTIIFGLKRAGRYAPMIQRVLSEEGVPQELIFLAQAESGFLPRAISNKNAVGMWQFMQFRGKEYGLNQTSATDDRLDPEKATRAAARHLHDLHDQFGDWYLAIAAYNCGPYCVEHAVARTGYADFWKLRSLGVLPKETTNYVPIIVAMTIMMKNAASYGLDNIVPDTPLEMETIKLTAPTHIGLIADAADRPVSEIRELNPALLKPVAPAGYDLHVPKGLLANVETAFSVVPESHRATWRMHRVGPGETLATIAKRYGMSTNSIAAINREASSAEEGETLVIPASYQTDQSFLPKRMAYTAPSRGRRGSRTSASTHSKSAARGRTQAAAAFSNHKAKAAARPVARRSSSRAASAAKQSAARKPVVKQSAPRRAAAPRGIATTASLH